MELAKLHSEESGKIGRDQLQAFLNGLLKISMIC